MNWKIITILLLASLLRLFWLNKFPVGITNDELHFVLNAKSVWLNFSDIRNQWNPLSFTTIPRETSSEIPFLLISPIVGPLPLNLFTARLPFVFVSVLTIFFLYLLVKNLTEGKPALFTALIMAINPWSIYVSRTSFDPPLAIFFFVLSLYLLSILKNWRILIAFIPLALGFYSYIATKVIFIPFVFISLVYFYSKNRNFLKPYLTLFLICLLVTIRYLFLIKSQPSTRLGELLTPFSTQTSSWVNYQRSQLIPSPLTPVFSNKITLYLDHFINKYLTNFSPQVLFLNGDSTIHVSLWQHGYFYFFDFFLILFGFLVLYQTNRRLFFLLIAFILLSPVPEALRSDSTSAYAFHSSLQYPFLFIILGIGLSHLHRRLSLPILLLYFFSLTNFLYLYFFRSPVYQPESFNFSYRLLSHTLSLIPANQPAFIVSPEPEVIFRSYLFYQNLLNPKSFSQIAQASRDYQHSLQLNNLIFTDSLNSFSPSPTDIIIADSSVSLPANIGGQTPLRLLKLSDNTPLFDFYQFSPCLAYSDSPFLGPISLASFTPETLSVESFCRTFLIK